jgi:hypothetical protein
MSLPGAVRGASSKLALEVDYAVELMSNCKSLYFFRCRQVNFNLLCMRASIRSSPQRDSFLTVRYTLLTPFDVSLSTAYVDQCPISVDREDRVDRFVRMGRLVITFFSTCFFHPVLRLRNGGQTHTDGSSQVVA